MRQRVGLYDAVFAAAVLVYTAFLTREALWLTIGPQDNDWPLLMWLARAGMRGNLDALAVGHYGFLQLVLVRILGPLVGGTLIAAKLLNVVSVAATCFALDRILRATSTSTPWRFAAVCVFALSYPTFVTGWSEFGDPLALAFFAWGLAVLIAWPTLRGALMGGALVGVAGLVRLHFQTMGWGTALAFAGFALTTMPRREAIRRGAVFTGAVLGAQLPVFVLNLEVHGTLFSPIAKTFMGQVLFGANEFDMANSYAAAPFDGLLSAHGMKLLSVIADRILDVPPFMAALLLGTLLSLVRRDAGQPMRAFALLLALGYYVGFVSPSWGITPRLLMGFIFLVAFGVGLVGHAIPATANPRVATLCACLVALAVGLHFRSERRAFRAVRNQTRAVWDRNVAITRAIRARGITNPTQVFAADWFVYPTDDPEMVGFYNWGFWNLLVPEFANERPNPYVVVGDPAAFESFLTDHGVRLLVLYDEPRLPAVRAIVRGESTLRAFSLVERIGDQYVYGLLE